MNLGNWLADNIIAEQKKIKTIVAIYPGRFQPMGRHHAKAYKWLKSKFKDAYVVTSDISGGPKHPFSFGEKKKIINKHGISNVVKVKNPYQANELLKKFDPETTAAVFMVGQKDASRLGGKFFQPWKGKAEVGYEDGAYTIIAPHESLNIPGYGEMSGTTIRKALGADISEDEKKKLFKDIFGFFNASLYKSIVDKLEKLHEIIASIVGPVAIKSLLGEASFDGGAGIVDDGPPTYFQTFKGYESKGQFFAQQVGWEVVDYILDGAKEDKQDEMREVDPVTYFPAGIAGASSAMNNTDLQGTPAYKAWFKRVSRIALRIGYKFVDLIGAKIAVKTSKAEPDKAPKVPENVISEKFSKVWWKPLVEAITLPVEIGDTVLMGKFKNKKVVVKDISWNEKGDLLINGKSAMRMRILPKQNIFDIVKQEQELDECITVAKMFDGDMIIGKNRDRNYKPRLKIVRDRTSYGIETCLIVDEDTDWVEGMNDIGIGLVNSALFVKRDEKDYDKAKKKMAPSKDGVRVREALSKGSLADAVKSLIIYHDGVKGHTTIGNGKKLVTIENTSRSNPIVKIKDLNKEPIVRTNHGIEHTEAGYQDGADKLSSELRLINALNVTHKTSDWENLFPNFYKHTQDKGPKFDLVRAQNKLWTSSQVAMNLNKKEIILYLVPEQVKFLGFENNLPKGYDPKIKVKIVTYDKKVYKNESILTEGGAYGHMAHPFDDKGLTFGDFKNMINQSLQGRLDLESGATEKTDGQNLFITWRDGKLRAARNTGDIKRGGVDSSAIAKKFAGRGNIEKAFNYAMNDLSKAIGSINDKQKDKIFNNGNNWVNMEIMYPASSNVINYDAPYLQFHNVLKYEKGSPVGSVPDGARILAGMIAQVNQKVQKNFSVIGPQILKVKPHQDFAQKVGYFNSKLNKLMSPFSMKDSNTFADYHQAWWEQFVDKNFPGIENRIRMGLVKRWGFNDKSFRLNGKTVSDKNVLEKIKSLDKVKVEAQVKKNMTPFESLFFELGAEVLKNAEGFLAANPDKAVQAIRKQVAAAISDVRKGGDLKKLNKVKAQLAKIQSIGGFDKIVPSEGLVFIYKGKTYKLTGIFAPINQLTGLMTF